MEYQSLILISIILVLVVVYYFTSCSEAFQYRRRRCKRGCRGCPYCRRYRQNPYANCRCGYSGCYCGYSDLRGGWFW